MNKRLFFLFLVFAISFATTKTDDEEAVAKVEKDVDDLRNKRMVKDNQFTKVYNSSARISNEVCIEVLHGYVRSTMYDAYMMEKDLETIKNRYDKINRYRERADTDGEFDPKLAMLQRLIDNAPASPVTTVTGDLFCNDYTLDADEQDIFYTLLNCKNSVKSVCPSKPVDAYVPFWYDNRRFMECRFTSDRAKEKFEVLPSKTTSTDICTAIDRIVNATDPGTEDTGPVMEVIGGKTIFQTREPALGLSFMEGFMRCGSEIFRKREMAKAHALRCKAVFGECQKAAIAMSSLVEKCTKRECGGYGCCIGCVDVTVTVQISIRIYDISGNLIAVISVRIQIDVTIGRARRLAGKAKTRKEAFKNLLLRSSRDKRQSGCAALIEDLEDIKVSSEQMIKIANGTLNMTIADEVEGKTDKTTKNIESGSLGSTDCTETEKAKIEELLIWLSDWRDIVKQRAKIISAINDLPSNETCPANNSSSTSTVTTTPTTTTNQTTTVGFNNETVDGPYGVGNSSNFNDVDLYNVYGFPYEIEFKYSVLTNGPLYGVRVGYRNKIGPWHGTKIDNTTVTATVFIDDLSTDGSTDEWVLKFMGSYTISRRLVTKFGFVNRDNTTFSFGSEGIRIQSKPELLQKNSNQLVVQDVVNFTTPERPNCRFAYFSGTSNLYLENINIHWMCN